MKEFEGEDLEHVARVQGLFVKHSAQIRGFILSLVPRSSEADDLLQETFLTVTAKAGGFEWGTNFVAWSMTIAKFKVLEHFRKGKKSELLLGQEVIEMLAEEGAADGIEEDGMEGKLKALSACLGELSPRVRKMLTSRYEQRMKPEKIAREVGWGANSVYVALSRARRSLRECIVNAMGGSASA